MPIVVHVVDAPLIEAVMRGNMPETLSLLRTGEGDIFRDANAAGDGALADAFSLGATLYVMLVGRFPEFERDGATGALPHGFVSELSRECVSRAWRAAADEQAAPWRAATQTSGSSSASVLRFLAGEGFDEAPPRPRNASTSGAAAAQGAARDPSNVKAAEAAARKMAEEALA